jgi:hypothetical protein
MKTMEETDPITPTDLLVLREDLAHSNWELKRQKIDAAEKQAALKKELSSSKAAARRDASKIYRLAERAHSVGPALTEARRVRFELKRLKIIALFQTAIVIAYFALKFSGILF